MRQVNYLIALAISAGALAATAMGCELIASVDRSTIGQGGEGGDGGAGGATTTTTTTSGGGMGGDGGQGGGCAADCELGEACTDGAACASGSCVDGVCCDAVCDGACEACTAALKQSGVTDGECGPAAASTSCGDTAACTAGVQSGADLCNDVGQCVGGSVTPCTPYICDPAGASCLSACGASSDCVSTHFCNMQMACVAKKTNGQTCQGADQCNSGNCVDGVCCNAACGTDCQSCNVAGSVGTCSNVPTGSTDGACMGTMVCDGAGMCKSVNGTTCAMGSTCLSGNCVDTVCCNTACSGDCQACNNAGMAGTCSNVPVGTVEPACSAPTNVCDGAGVCKLGIGAVCVNNSDCASGNCSGMAVKTCQP